MVRLVEMARVEKTIGSELARVTTSDWFVIKLSTPSEDPIAYIKSVEKKYARQVRIANQVVCWK